MVCIGPPKPSRNPRPHGMRHCQKYDPGVAGALKLNVTVVCGPEVHGDVPHRLLLAASVVGEAIGTFRPMPGMENVCATEHSPQELSTCVGLPFTYSTLPTVPLIFPQNGFRSGVQPS